MYVDISMKRLIEHSFVWVLFRPSTIYLRNYIFALFKISFIITFLRPMSRKNPKRVKQARKKGI